MPFTPISSSVHWLCNVVSVALTLSALILSPDVVADTELQGPEVYVPPTSFRVTEPQPACQGNVKDANAPVKFMLDKFGTALTNSGDPVVTVVGYIASTVDALMPADKVQNYANCAMPCITLPAGRLLIA
jgi:hypothetical protein